MKIPRSLLLAAQTGHDIACERDECGVQMDGQALARTGAIEAYREELLRVAKAVQSACFEIAGIQNAIAFLDLDELIDHTLAEKVEG